MTWYPVVNDLIGGWAVSQSPLPMSEKPQGVPVAADFIASESVASIIAFALNAVAAGHELAYITEDRSIPYEQDVSYEVYDGPTAGVAPGKEKPPAAPGASIPNGGGIGDREGAEGGSV